MAKSKRRAAMAATQQANWKSMTPEALREWNEHRRKTAKSGYAKRQRERNNGAPMASRTGEGLSTKRFVPPFSRPDPMFAGWLQDFQRRTAA